jgi:hypothetical protein
MSPCRAPLVVCAAPDRERLRRLKVAAVGATWELSAGATSAEEALAQLHDHHAIALVVDEPVPGLVDQARARFPELRIVVLAASGRGADAALTSLDEVRDAIVGESRGGGAARR